MSDILTGSNVNIGTKKIKGLRDGLMVYQTFTAHAVGVGQLDLPIWIPYDCYLEKFRFRIASAGSGGSMSVDLRLNGIAGGNTISGSLISSFATGTPSWTTPTAPGFTLAEDDELWPYVVTMSHTTPGYQLRLEAKLVRR